jgi:hypothetical protein
MSTGQRRCSRCQHWIPTWDSHSLCTACRIKRGVNCSQSRTCSTCGSWGRGRWLAFELYSEESVSLTRRLRRQASNVALADDVRPAAAPRGLVFPVTTAVTVAVCMSVTTAVSTTVDMASSSSSRPQTRAVTTALVRHSSAASTPLPTEAAGSAHTVLGSDLDSTSGRSSDWLRPFNGVRSVEDSAAFSDSTAVLTPQATSWAMSTSSTTTSATASGAVSLPGSTSSTTTSATASGVVSLPGSISSTTTSATASGAVSLPGSNHLGTSTAYGNHTRGTAWRSFPEASDLPDDLPWGDADEICLGPTDLPPLPGVTAGAFGGAPASLASYVPFCHAVSPTSSFGLEKGGGDVTAQHGLPTVSNVAAAMGSYLPGTEFSLDLMQPSLLTADDDVFHDFGLQNESIWDVDEDQQPAPSDDVTAVQLPSSSTDQPPSSRATDTSPATAAFPSDRPPLTGTGDTPVDTPVDTSVKAILPWGELVLASLAQRDEVSQDSDDVDLAVASTSSQKDDGLLPSGDVDLAEDPALEQDSSSRCSTPVCDERSTQAAAQSDAGSTGLGCYRRAGPSASVSCPALLDLGREDSSLFPVTDVLSSDSVSPSDILLQDLLPAAAVNGAGSSPSDSCCAVPVLDVTPLEAGSSCPRSRLRRAAIRVTHLRTD